jgi:hypothetical protein
MLEQTDKEMLFVTKSLNDSGFRASLQRFGSTISGNGRSKSDFDVAVIVPNVEKSGVVDHLRQLGGSPKRSMNWAIDVFNRRGETFGYNRRGRGILHLLVMSQKEYEGYSPLAVNVRAAMDSNGRLK